MELKKQQRERQMRVEKKPTDSSQRGLDFDERRISIDDSLLEVGEVDRKGQMEERGCY